jgi:uncharacterized protein YndB with AHSA1/START domain
MKPRVTLSVFYPHPPEKVWRALTDPAALRRWLLPTDSRPRPGRAFRFQEPARRRRIGTVCCEVVEMEAPCRLAYTWQGERDSAPTRVTWTLEPEEGGTRLHLEHAGPEMPTALAFQLEARQNWKRALSGALPAVLRSPGSERRAFPVGRIALPDTNEIVRCVSQRRLRAYGRREKQPC